MVAPSLERDVGANRVQSLEWIVEPIRGRFGIPGSRHLIRFPKVESTEVIASAGLFRGAGACFGEALLDERVIHSQLLGSDVGLSIRVIILVVDGPVIDA